LKSTILGNCTTTYVTVDEVQNSGHGIDGYHSVGTALRQISLAGHHAFVQLARAVVPIVIHGGQDLGEYSTKRSPSFMLLCYHEKRAQRIENESATDSVLTGG